MLDAAPAAPALNGAARARCRAVAVVNGPGLAEMFRELGVHTVDGGPTLNPSTTDLLAGIHAVGTEEVVVFPNSPNVVLTAEHAAHMSEREVFVAPTTNQQAGLVAALALMPGLALEQNERAVVEALARLRTGAVTPASRDDAQGRFRRGEALGYVEGELLAWGEPAETLRAVLSSLAQADNGSTPELISVLAGEDAPLGLAQVQDMAEEGVELELRDGGQPTYWWLLAAE
jgi:dihydroxyacetone kinase-like predicted kinase